MKGLCKWVGTRSGHPFYNDRPYKFSQVDGIYSVISAGGYTWVYNEFSFSKKFRIIEEGITTAKPKKETWKFTVSSDTLINLNEIEKNLTRERPVAIVSYNTEGNYKVATVLIHESIMDKAYTLPSNYSDELQKALNPIHESQLDGTAGFVDIRTNFTRPLMKAIKAIRTAAIPRKRKGHLEVTVDMMEV